jgi:hypothetical protein
MSVIASSQLTGSKPRGPRRSDAVGVVVNLGERDALLTREARRQRMVLVRPKRHEPTILDGGDHAAQRLADPAERRLVLDHSATVL